MSGDEESWRWRRLVCHGCGVHLLHIDTIAWKSVWWRLYGRNGICVSNHSQGERPTGGSVASGCSIRIGFVGQVEKDDIFAVLVLVRRRITKRDARLSTLCRRRLIADSHGGSDRASVRWTCGKPRPRRRCSCRRCCSGGGRRTCMCAACPGLNAQKMKVR